MAEQKLPKLTTRVRFPSPAPFRFAPIPTNDRGMARAGLILAVWSALATVPLAAAPSPAALVITGIRTEGDVPSALTKVLDLRTGHSRMTFAMGDHDTQAGFDGMD